jgi:hypothetical protein
MHAATPNSDVIGGDVGKRSAGSRSRVLAGIPPAVYLGHAWRTMTAHHQVGDVTGFQAVRASVPPTAAMRGKKRQTEMRESV